MRILRQASKRLGCALAAAALAFVSALPTPALAGTEVEKSETVHVQTDASGTVLSIRVDEALANASGAPSVEDRSNLRDIVPADEDQSFVRSDGQAITWSTGGKPVSYRGTSDEKPPVGIAVSYRLDGREVRPAELVGATGHLDVRVEYTLDAVSSEDADASTTPFVCMTVAFLDSDVFSNVVVENGRVVDDKGSLAVVGLVVPGLEDSLGLEDSGLDIDLDLPEYLTISADVQDFALDPIYTIVTPELFTDLDMGDLHLGLEDFDEGTDALRQAVDALVEGAGTLSSGLQQLAGGSRGLSGGTRALHEALGQLPTGLDGLSTGAHALADGLTAAGESATQLADGAEQLNAGTAKGLEAVGAVQSSVEGAMTATGSLRASLESLPNASEALSAAHTAATDAQGAAQRASQELAAYGQGIEGGKATVSKAVGSATGLLGEATTSISDASSSLDKASALLGSISTEGLSEGQIQAIKSVQGILSSAGKSLASADADLGSMGSQLGSANSGLEAMGAALPTSVSQDIATLDGSAATLERCAGEIGEIVGPDSAPSSALADLSTIETALSGASGGLAVCRGVLDGVVAGSERLGSGASSIAEVLDQLSGGAGELAGGVDRIALAAPRLVDGAGRLSVGAAQLTEALQRAAEGSQQLTNGLSSFDEQGIGELVDSLRQLGEGTDELRGRLDSLRDAARRYDNFAGKAEGQSGSVRFVYKTEQIG